MLGTDALLKIVQQRAPVYDKDREGHYNLISALHKSLRGSDKMCIRDSLIPLLYQWEL